MNDTNQQQNTNTTDPVAVTQGVSAFGGSVPYSNIPQAQSGNDNTGVVYAGGPEASEVAIGQPEAAKQPETSAEVQKATENMPETLKGIERKEQKSFYPQNVQQQPQQQVQPQVKPVLPIPAKPIPKFFGYMVSPQISTNHTLISSLKGKGDTGKSRTWIYMLLDRILKKQAYVKK